VRDNPEAIDTVERLSEWGTSQGRGFNALGDMDQEDGIMISFDLRCTPKLDSKAMAFEP